MKNLYEWDENKRKINLEKHQIDFIDILDFFEDLDRIEFECSRADERRFQSIGIVNEVVIFLVYTLRGNKKRIISARKASKNERKAYYEEKN